MWVYYHRSVQLNAIQHRCDLLQWKKKCIIINHKRVQRDMIDDSIHCCRVMSSRLRFSQLQRIQSILWTSINSQTRSKNFSMAAMRRPPATIWHNSNTHTHTRFHSHSRAHYICPLSRSHEQRSDNMPTVSGEIWLRLVVKPRVNILLFFSILLACIKLFVIWSHILFFVRLQNKLKKPRIFANINFFAIYTLQPNSSHTHIRTNRFKIKTFWLLE